MTCFGSYFLLSELMQYFVVSIQQETQYAIDALVKSAQGANEVELSKVKNVLTVVGSPDYLITIVNPLRYLITFLVFWIFVICIYYEIKLKKSPNKQINQDK